MVSRNLSLDILKVVLSIFVVALHCQFLFDVSNEAYYATVHGLFRLAVPIFLIVSGFYFFNIKNTIDLKKWCFRIGLLYILWMIAYSPVWFNPSSMIFNLITIFYGYFVLWYLSGTLVSGVIVYYIKNLNFKLLSAIALFTFLIGFAIQTLGNMHIFHGKIDAFINMHYLYRNAIFVCLPYFLTGYLINKYEFDKKIKSISPLWVFISIVIVMFESVFQSRFISNTDAIEQLLTLPIASVLVFLYFKNKVILGKSKDLANFSTAIYLIHPLFLLLVLKYCKINETIMTAIVLLLSFIASYFLVKINKKLKYIL